MHSMFSQLNNQIKTFKTKMTFIEHFPFPETSMLGQQKHCNKNTQKYALLKSLHSSTNSMSLANLAQTCRQNQHVSRYMYIKMDFCFRNMC